MKFCDILRELRINAGFTQKELADKLKISAGAIGLYEQGRRKPDDETLISLSIIFNVSVDYLLGLEDKIPSSSEIGLSEIDFAMLNSIKKLNDSDKKNIMNLINSIVDKK